MLIGKLFHIGYTPRGSVVVDASARLVRPDPRPRTLERVSAPLYYRLLASGDPLDAAAAARAGASRSGCSPSPEPMYA